MHTYMLHNWPAWFVCTATGINSCWFDCKDALIICPHSLRLTLISIHSCLEGTAYVRLLDSAGVYSCEGLLEVFSFPLNLFTAIYSTTLHCVLHWRTVLFFLLCWFSHDVKMLDTRIACVRSCLGQVGSWFGAQIWNRNNFYFRLNFWS